MRRKNIVMVMRATNILLLAGIVLGGALTLAAQTWTPAGTPSKIWETVAASADGSKLIAGGQLWVYCLSTNSGSTWATYDEPQTNSSFGGWTAIASSADGNTLAAINFTAVWISTDAGLTWVSNNVPGAGFFSSLALSADGNKLVVADGKNTPGLIYTSTNAGITLTPSSAPTNYWSSVASSADGTKLVAATFNPQGPEAGFIFISTNSGLTWTLTSAPTNNYWGALASSADGSKLAAASSGTSSGAPNGGGVYTSTDFGATWTSNNLPVVAWHGISSSADGTKLVAVADGGNLDDGGCSIYSSGDSGATWVSNNVPKYFWGSVASSADGDMLIAAPFQPQPLYVSQTISSPQLSLAPSPAHLTLSCIVPSTNFILQQSSALTTTGWSDVTNVPVLNLTNLQNQVTLPLPAGNAFYRLKTP